VVLNTPIKINAPEVFTGKSEKLETFILQLRLIFGFMETQFTTEASKVLYASSLMRGAASEWFSGYLANYLDAQMGVPGTELQNATRDLFNNFENFCEGLRKIYGNPDAQREAGLRIQTLRQSGTVHEYTSEFYQLSNKLDWDDDAFVAIYYRGLKDPIKDELSRDDLPEELAQLAEKAARIDSRQRERQLEKKRTSYPIPFKRRHDRQTSSTPWPQAMDLDSVETRPRTGKAQGKKKTSFKCYNCGKEGHYAKECRSRKTEGDPKTAKDKTSQRGRGKGKRTINVMDGLPTSENSRNSDNEEYDFEYDSMGWSETHDGSELAEQEDSVRPRLDLEKVEKFGEALMTLGLLVTALKDIYDELPGAAKVKIDDALRRAETRCQSVEDEERDLERTAFPDLTQEEKGKGPEAEPLTGTAYSRHLCLHWTGCFDNECTTHNDRPKVMRPRVRYCTARPDEQPNSNWAYCTNDGCQTHVLAKHRANWFPQKHHDECQAPMALACTRNECRVHLPMKRNLRQFPEEQQETKQELWPQSFKECNQAAWMLCFAPLCPLHINDKLKNGYMPTSMHLGPLGFSKNS